MGCDMLADVVAACMGGPLGRAAGMIQLICGIVDPVPSLATRHLPSATAVVGGSSRGEPEGQSAGGAVSEIHQAYDCPS